jgi:hypothetical protein
LLGPSPSKHARFQQKKQSLDRFFIKRQRPPTQQIATFQKLLCFSAGCSMIRAKETAPANPANCHISKIAGFFGGLQYDQSKRGSRLICASLTQLLPRSQQRPEPPHLPKYQ